MAPALIFDCDGVLADTERNGHLPAFNQTFAELGLPVRWSDEEYAKLVRIGGGKERMKTLLTPEFVAENGLPTDAVGQRELLRGWHKRKTAIYTELVNGGALPARPGIARLAKEAAASGWLLAVASTSAEPSVRAVLEHTVGEELARLFSVFAGDVVDHKKPSPDIYLLALRELDADPSEGVVIEDSAVGLAASRAAGLATVVTVSAYSAGEEFDGAALVVDSLGDPAEPAEVLADPLGIRPGEAVSLGDLATLLDRSNQARFAAAATPSATAQTTTLMEER